MVDGCQVVGLLGLFCFRGCSVLVFVKNSGLFWIRDVQGFVVDLELFVFVVQGF